MKSWGASLAIHAAVLGLGAALWPRTPPEPEPDRFRWEVAFTPAAQPLPPASPKPPPPKPQARTPDTPPPRPAAAAPGPPKPPPMALEPVASGPAPALPSSPGPAPAVTEPPPAAPVAQHARPAPSPPPVDAAAEAERRWYAALVDKLREMKRYPLPARRLGQEGVVLLAVQVAADGRLVSVQVKKGSGHAILDRDAVTLLEGAAEAARDDLRPERSAQLEIPIAYRLERDRL